MRRIIVSVFVLVTLVLIASCQHDITDPESPDTAILSHPTTNSNVRVLKLAGEDLDNAATLHGATGLAMLDRDHLLVGSLLGLEIATVDIHSGHIDGRLRPADGVEGPDDVIVAPDGSIYWSNFWTGEVRRLTPEGDLSSVLVGRGAGPLAISPSGDVYVARRFLGQGLYALDPELTLAPVELLNAGEIGGLAFDASGRLFASSWTHGGIMRIWIENDVPTATWVAGGFNVPAGIVFEPDGRLLVAEFATGEVWRLELPTVNSHNDPFDSSPPDEKTSTGDRTRVTTLSPGILSIALDPRGHFFVSNGQNGSVTKVYSYGYQREVCQGGLIMPGGLALHANGDDTTPLWIADAWTLREFNRETGNCSNIHRCVLGVNGFTAPMTVNGDGTELIVSSWLGCVQVIDPSTCELVECYDYREIGAKPVNSIRYHGEVVVAEHMSGSVFRAHDQSLLAGGFVAPTGLAASNGDLWVADRGTGTVWWIAHDGIPLTEKVAVATGLAAPEGLVALSDRVLVVAETDAGRLSRIDLRSGSIMVLAEGLDFGLEAAAGMPPSWGFTDITVDAVNNLAYVSSDVANLVYVIDLPAGRHHGDMMDEGVINP